MFVGIDAKASALRMRQSNVFMEEQIRRVQFLERQWKVKRVRTTGPQSLTFTMQPSLASWALGNSHILAIYSSDRL